MSGAQPKAATIAGAVGVFAEVDASRIQTRLDQGWVNLVSDDLNAVFSRAEQAQAAGEKISIAYHGNIVDLLEAAIARGFAIDMLSDQTSCHNAYNGGYCPVGLTFEERTELLHRDREAFAKRVDASLRRHFDAIVALSERGTRFFDYGNSFLKAVFDAGVTEVSKNRIDAKDGFIFPSYVEDIMGPLLFDYATARFAGFA
jgi:urocanate hydratase